MVDSPEEGPVTVGKASVNAANDFDEAKVPSWASGYFSQADAEKISQVVAVAEQSTEGEIVPMVVHSSVPRWPTSALIMMAMIILGLVVNDLLELAGLGFFLALIVSVALGVLLSKVDQLHRWIAPEAWVREEVAEMAELEFYRTRIHHTQKKTGILIFISLQEHRVIVLGDEAISTKLAQGTWTELVQLISQGMRNGQAASGLEAAIQRCGQILAQHFPRSVSDQNELSNRLLFKKGTS